MTRLCEGFNWQESIIYLRILETFLHFTDPKNVPYSSYSQCFFDLENMLFEKRDDDEIERRYQKKKNEYRVIINPQADEYICSYRLIARKIDQDEIDEDGFSAWLDQWLETS